MSGMEARRRNVQPKQPADAEVLAPSVETKDKAIRDKLGLEWPRTVHLEDNSKRVYPGGLLEPLKKGKNYSQSVTRSLEYLSRTGGIEIGTPRVESLQRIAEKMAGPGQPVKIIILNRAWNMQGFVFPEGSIFLSQSLLNKLDTVDEVAAVIAHEILHLKHDTYAKRTTAHSRGGAIMGQFLAFGVGWVHEMAGDMRTPELMEKAGLNSMAFSSAIKKISGVDRGIIHQGGLTRATQVHAMQHVIDFTTSKTKATPLPPEFHGRVVANNLEVYGRYVDEGFPWMMRKHFWKLHGHDVKSINQHVHSRNYQTLFRVPMQSAVFGEMSRRLSPHGYPKDEQEAFFINQIPLSADEVFFKRIRNPAMTLARLKTTVECHPRKTFAAMHERCFEMSPEETDSVRHFAELLKDKMKIRNHRGSGMPMNRKHIIPTLLAFPAGFDRQITEIMTEFCERSYGGVLKGRAMKNAEALFEEAKEARVKISLVELERYISNNQEQADASKDYPETHRLFQRRADLGRLCLKVFFGREDIQLNLEQLIDSFLKSLDKDGPAHGKGIFFDTLAKRLDRGKLKEAVRAALMERADKTIDTLTFGPRVMKNTFREYQGNWPSGKDEPPPQEVERVRAIVRFNLKAAMALALYHTDSPGFYEYMAGAMERSGIDCTKETTEALTAIAAPLLIDSASVIDVKRSREKKRLPLAAMWWGDKDEDDRRSHTPVRALMFVDLERHQNLPFMRELLTRREEPARNIDELYTRLKRALGRHLWHVGAERGEAFDIYSDALAPVLLCRDFRENFAALAERGFQLSEYDALAGFITKAFPDCIQKDEWLRAIDKAYLRAESVDIQAKISYVRTHFDRIGVEGAIIVADQIDDLKVYQQFRSILGSRLTGYLDGSKKVSYVASADLGTQLITHRHDLLFQSASTDPEKGKKVSSEAADAWLDTFIEDTEFWVLWKKITIKKSIYDAKKRKFLLTSGQRAFFSSFKDMIARLKAASLTERGSMTLKALTDKEGALATKKNRAAFAKNVVSSLNLKDEFSIAVLSEACKDGDASEVVALAASRMIAPLLFRGLDEKAVSMNRVSRRGISRKDRRHLLTSSTRDILELGITYRLQPSSQASRMARASDEAYTGCAAALDAQFVAADRAAVNHATEVTDGGIPAEEEAVIRGVEASGAIGVRSLQFATQLIDFRPAMRKRLAKSFDANEGLNKLLFWENLVRLGEKDPQVQAFLDNNLISLGRYMGGGSLYTTYRARVKESGGERDVVVKMLNPNAEGLLDKNHQIAQAALKRAGKLGKHRGAIRTARVVTDLSKSWCIRDINDPSFREDDVRFEEVVRAYNARGGSRKMVKPKLMFTHAKIKVEDIVGTSTLNQQLENDDIPEVEKRALVKGKSDFFIYQLRHAPRFKDKSGRSYAVVHSDPSVGNYMVTAQGGLGVIDRNMYLKLYDQDIQVIESFMRGEGLPFLNKFIGNVLDKNAVQSSVTRMRVRMALMNAVLKERGRQRASGEDDKVAMLHAVVEKLSNMRVRAVNGTNKLDLTLDLLMMRNVQAEKELCARFGVSLGREAASGIKKAA